MTHLFESVKFGNLELKNRIFMAPMGFSNTASDGGLSNRQIEFYVERAKGGFGLIFPACHIVTTQYDTPPLPNVLENYSQGARLSLLANKLHHYGAKLCMQLSLGFGRLSFHIQDPLNPPVSASAVPSFWSPEIICKPLTIDNIRFLIKCLGNAALIAKNAGADAIELQAVGGYLLDQFLNPAWNKRTDQYGGNIENRARILYELRDEVWSTCGKDFPIFVKFTLDHCSKDGIKLEEGIEFAKSIDGAGFTMLHLDMGTYYESLHKAIPTIYQNEGLQLHLADELKKNGVKTPLLIQGKLGSPELAEKVVKDGLADLIGLGHQALADPHWPNKVVDHKYDEIIPCIGCNECINSVFSNRAFSCAVNPLTGAEKDYALTPEKEHRSILVIGSGPAGMMSAITAAQRGFEVELWEKERALGGALLAAGAPHFKSDIARYLAYLKNMVYSTGVEVQLEREATVEDISKKNPDVVIIATGAKPVKPEIKGISRHHVWDASDILSANEISGEKIVIVGGGIVGCETALYLDGMGKDVTIVEILDELLMTAQHAMNNDIALRNMVAISNVKVLTSSTLKSIDDSRVKIRSGETESELNCDIVVIAAGFEADNSFAKAIDGMIDKVFTIGDSVKPGRIIDAVHQGFHTIRLLEDLR